MADNGDKETVRWKLLFIWFIYVWYVMLYDDDI